jgi:hypothetical protein
MCFENLLKEFEDIAERDDADYRIRRKRALAAFLSERCYADIDRRMADVPRYDCIEDYAHRAVMKYDKDGDWILFDEAMKAIEVE